MNGLTQVDFAHVHPPVRKSITPTDNCTKRTRPRILLSLPVGFLTAKRKLHATGRNPLTPLKTVLSGKNDQTRTDNKHWREI